MKKLLSLSVVAVALAALLTGCASSGAKKASGSSVPHPRTYTIDVIDGGETVNLVWNQYGPNFQATPEVTKFLKADKPQAGDTVIMKMKAVSDVDLPLLLGYPCSTSPAWTNLCGESLVFAEGVKAGEVFECEVSCVLTTKMGTNFMVCLQYDNPDQEVKTGGPANLTLERVCDTTDTSADAAPIEHIAHTEVALERKAAFFEIATNHPWVNGVQDMSVVSNYQGVADITNAFNADSLPVAGDTLKVTWKAVSDNDIAKIYMRVIDNSPAANWWKELDVNAGSGALLIEDVKAGVPFEASMDITFGADSVGGVALCVWYDIGDAEGPSIVTMVRE